MGRKKTSKKAPATGVAKRKSTTKVLSARTVGMTKTISGLRKNCLKIGDSQYNLYMANDDLGHLAAALAGYKQALDSAKVQITYQKNSGRVKKIPFCEE
tara:strand:+ start:1160 stop:1456 length:297 start_codon:yes stop_codon:yes gene_type:complete